MLILSSGAIDQEGMATITGSRRQNFSAQGTVFFFALDVEYEFGPMNFSLVVDAAVLVVLYDDAPNKSKFQYISPDSHQGCVKDRPLSSQGGKDDAIV